MMWERVKLADVSDSCLGKMLDQRKNKGIYKPYLANVNVRWGAFDLDNLQEMKFEDDEDERYGIKYGDLIICEGGEPGRCAIWKEQLPNMKIQKALHRLRVNEEMDYRYVYYWFLLAGKQGALKQYYTGATIMHMPGQKLKEVVIDKPPLDVQRKIGDYLEAFDDLIENNQKQIKLLEEAAQRLYKEWFVDLRFPGYEDVEIVDGVPEGWEITPINMVANLKAGGDKPKTFSEKMTNENKIPVFANGITGKGLMGFTDKAVINNPSVTISARGTVGVVFLRTEPYVPIVRLISVTPIEDKVDILYLYLYLINQNFRSTGAAQQQITVPLLKSKNIICPTDDVRKSFNDVITSIFNKIDILEKHINKLTEARDRLLPKLMNGEIEV
ncbi:MAG: restriction endonuclease subunit S [Anaerotignum faecicola]